MTYQTWQASKRTSSSTVALEETPGVVMLNYTGELPWGKTLRLSGVKHIWITSSQPITITGLKTNTVPPAVLFGSNGLMLWTTAFADDDIELHIDYPEPLSDSESESASIELQVLARSLNFDEIGSL